MCFKLFDPIIVITVFQTFYNLPYIGMLFKRSLHVYILENERDFSIRWSFFIIMYFLFRISNYRISQVLWLFFLYTCISFFTWMFCIDCNFCWWFESLVLKVLCSKFNDSKWQQIIKNANYDFNISQKRFSK